VPDTDLRTHEIAFCSRVAGRLNALFAAHPEWPFRRAEIEQSHALRRKQTYGTTVQKSGVRNKHIIRHVAP
jgi:hypothetical protein